MIKTDQQILNNEMNNSIDKLSSTIINGENSNIELENAIDICYNTCEIYGTGFLLNMYVDTLLSSIKTSIEASIYISDPVKLVNNAKIIAEYSVDMKSANEIIDNIQIIIIEKLYNAMSK